MLSKLKKLFFISFFAGLFLALLGLAFLYFTTAGYELRSNGKKYVDMNISQNWGIRKFILVQIDNFLSLMPVPEDIPFDKDSALQGAKPHKSSIASLLIGAQRIVKVNNEADLVNAIRRAQAGDFILLAPGEYTVKRRTIIADNGGNAQQPIVLAAEQLGQVSIKLDSLEGLLIEHPYWIIKNLQFEGICQFDGECEHAIHLYGDADHALIENNVFRNFNSPLKANGNYSFEKSSFADNVVVSNNDFYNDRLRKTGMPTTAIDVVGGNNWVIKDNFIADYARVRKRRVEEAYMAFLKGAGQNSLFENNVVLCSWKVPHQSSLDIRVGMSLGNGGTGKQFCQDGRCDYEHSNGVIRRNIILNCRNDVGIYLNKASSTRVEQNVILNTYGIDARFNETSGSFVNNIMHGRIRSRDGGFISERDNHLLSPNEPPDQQLMDAILSQ